MCHYSGLRLTSGTLTYPTQNTLYNECKRLIVPNLRQEFLLYTRPKTDALYKTFREKI